MRRGLTLRLTLKATIQSRRTLLGAVGLLFDVPEALRLGVCLVERAAPCLEPACGTKGTCQSD